MQPRKYATYMLTSLVIGTQFCIQIGIHKSAMQIIVELIVWENVIMTTVNEHSPEAFTCDYPVQSISTSMNKIKQVIVRKRLN